MSGEKLDGPVLDDENFVNVDPDFAHYSSPLDRPEKRPAQEDWNVPPEFRDKKDDSEDGKVEEDEKSTLSPGSQEGKKPVTPPATPTLPAASK